MLASYSLCEIKIFDMNEDAKLIKTIDEGSRGFEWSTDGSKLAVADGKILKIFDLNQDMEKPILEFKLNIYPLVHLEWSKDDKFISIQNYQGHQIMIIDAQTGNIVKTIRTELRGMNQVHRVVWIQLNNVNALGFYYNQIDKIKIYKQFNVLKS